LNLVQSAFVEEAGEWVISPGEATNVLLKLLRADEGFGNENCGASARLKPQGSVKHVVQWNTLCRNDLAPSKRPKAEGVGGATDTSLEESDLPEPKGGEPQASQDKTARRHVHEKGAGIEPALGQDDYRSGNQCEQNRHE
jgi:hypothetical protein